MILVGDSTLAPRTGYGNTLCSYFRPEVECVNLARGGRSSMSFRAEGLWKGVQELLADGSRTTYVLVQFGHNDQPGKPGRSTDLSTEFPVNMRRYVDEVRERGAIPVLLTPLTRRSFRDGALVNDLAPWADATREVGKATGVAVLEINAESAAAVSRMGSTEADTLAMPPPDFDRTHLGSKGGAYFARLVARHLGRAVPDLAPLLTVRPQLNEAQAARYAYRAVLAGDPRDGWDPLTDPFATRTVPLVDATVDRAAKADGQRTFATVQSAIDAASTRTGRMRILVKPGVYEELIYVPDTGASITLVGGGSNAGETRIRANLFSRMTGERYAAAYGAAFANSPPAIAAMHASVKERAEIGTAGSSVAWIRGAGFQARNLTFENAYNRGVGDERGQNQAVAMQVDGADKVQFDDVRFLGFQDTLYLKSSGGKIPRIFIHRSQVHGDMDFIFGDATAYFLDSEIRTIGAFRKESFALAPSTHHATRFGFVFHRCAFTADDSANARAGVFKLARQWPQGQKPEAVGKAIILESRIGAHIDKLQPWASWNAPGSPRYRVVQYDSDDYLGYAAGPMPAEPYLAEFRNTHD
ncbi:hypothetical protein DSM104440_01435 [Usitatibacter palustris]|uniref:Pectinesterase catalytic domain-containing protein n=1 Tax=Usitatibacter palustris TaxID=2732487 RepID=A0A6M4H6Q1_9PROT|nr:hypothetical protein DSM104440_01435 [Usitatibacter palustris]